MNFCFTMQCEVDIPVQICQSFNYNMDRNTAEQELLIPKNGFNLMKIELTPLVIGNYPVGFESLFENRVK